MLHFFPSAFPDETLYSRMARYHKLSGHFDDRASLRELIGLHTHVVTSDLPSSLQLLVSKIPQTARPSVEELIHSHTVFPYFKAFLPAERSDHAIEAMSSISTSGLKMTLGLVASRLGGKNVFRFCRSCINADVSSHGQAYWHRIHQLPGAWVCPVHLEVVSELNLSVAQLKRHKLFLPDDPFVATNAVPMPISKHQIDAVQRISLLSKDLLMTKQSCPSQQAWNDSHRSHATRNGLIRRNGRIRVGELTDMLAQYALSFPTSREYTIICHRPLEWALKLLRRPRGNVIHPLKHIFLLDCLRGERAFYGAEGTARPAKAGRVKEQQRPQIDGTRLVTLLAEERLTLTQAADELGLSVTTVGVEAERLGLVTRRRPKSLTGEVRQRVCQSLRGGLTPQEVANLHSLSLVSVYRILRMDEVLAADHAEQRFRQCRDAYRKRFTGQERDRTDYSWLRRHDRAWLDEQKAAVGKGDVTRKSCVDWVERDTLWAQRVVEISASMLSLAGKPKWISRAALEREIFMAETIERNAEKLPGTHAALAACAESFEEYQRRRLCWAARELEKQGKGPLQRWQLLRLAGVRTIAHQNNDLLEELASSSKNPGTDGNTAL